MRVCIPEVRPANADADHRTPDAGPRDGSARACRPNDSIQPAADPCLVIEPHPGLGPAITKPPQAALGAPSAAIPWPATHASGLAQKLNLQKLLRPARNSHRRPASPPGSSPPPRAGIARPVGPRAATVTCRGLIAGSGTRWIRTEFWGIVAPGSAIFPRPATSELVHPSRANHPAGKVDPFSQRCSKSTR